MLKFQTIEKDEIVEKSLQNCIIQLENNSTQKLNIGIWTHYRPWIERI